jgi:hypothetical protein
MAKMTDSDLLYIMLANLETEYYDYGSDTQYDELDIPNLKCYCGYAKDDDTEENP